MTEFPEHAKLHAIAHLSNAQGEFVDWLQNEKGIVLAKYEGNKLYEDNTSLQKLLAEFHAIDLQKINAEKKEMLVQMRKC